MGKAQGSGQAKRNKVKGQCKEKTLVVQKIREKKNLKRRTNTKVSRRRRRVTKVKDALDCCVLLTRLDSRDVKKAPKRQNNRRAKIKQRTKSDQPRLKHQALQQIQESERTHSSASLEFSWEPRRRRMASLNAEAVNSLLLFRENPPSVSKKQQLSTDNPKEHTHEHKGHKTKKSLQGDKKTHKSKKDSVTQDQSIDWLSLLAPTPRRQAGLTAATLLKLTSAQYTSKRQKKREVKQETGTESTAQSDTQRKSDHKTQRQHKEQLKDRERSRQLDPAPQGCSVCSAHTVEPGWSSRGCLKSSVQKKPTLSFSSKIKEEQLESQVSSCYCCNQEQCVQYCHRLALFLRDKSFPGQDGSLSSVFHHHHHHHHLPALGTHSYTCFPGYYFHLCHPADASQDHVYPHSTKRAKLLGAQSSGAPGISHPIYCCTSVEPCFDPCTISGYQAYSSVIPAMGCTKCNNAIKKEEYSPALRDLHSPSSLSMCPSPRFLTACPNSLVPPAGQSAPHVQPPPSEPNQPAATLPLGRKCPQSAKAPRAHLDSRATRDRRRAPSAANRGRSVPSKWRHKSTNGWQPLGLSFQREVFSVGEETLVPRTCFEAVQRDGDVVQVRDTVLLKSGPRKKCLPYVAKVSALWEDPDSGELMMSLFWYYRPEHTQGGYKPNVHCENEVFASRHQDVNSVACIEDKCYVLPLAQYCRFRALVKRQQEGLGCGAASLVPPALENGQPTHHCVPPDVDPQLVFFCRHVYDFRYGRLLKNLQ